LTATTPKNIDDDYCTEYNPTRRNEIILSYSAPLWHNVPKTIKKKVYDIHHRMGHANMDFMCRAVSIVGGSWANSGITAKDIRKVFHSEPCLICSLSKRNLTSPMISMNHRHWKPGELICADPVPRISPQSYNKDVGFFLFVDMASGYLHTIPTRDDNSSFAYIQAIQIVMRFYTTYNCVIKTIRTDGEMKLLSEEVAQFLSDKHIEIESSGPYAHYQNGAERNIQTIMKGTATLLHAQPWLRADCWNEALRHCTHLRNHTPNSKTSSISPWKIITNKDTDLSSTFNFVFGDFVAHISNSDYGNLKKERIGNLRWTVRHFETYSPHIRPIQT
jgi:hypothetical protein